MVDYARLKLLAERLIEENGRTLTVTRKDEIAAADPAEPWRENLTSNQVSVIVIGVVIEFENDELDGDLVRRGDKRALISAKSMEDEAVGSSNTDLEFFDTLLDGTSVWKIESVKAIAPGTVEIFYDLQLRK